MLLRGLPPEAQLWEQLRRAHERSLKPTPEQIRERQQFYDEQAKAGEQ